MNNPDPSTAMQQASSCAAHGSCRECLHCGDSWGVYIRCEHPSWEEETHLRYMHPTFAEECSDFEPNSKVSSTAWFDSVFDALKNIGGAHESMRKDFIYHHARSVDPCDEYRFQGKLGFGGKYWRTENRVSCYREDETPERLRLISELDATLAKLANESTSAKARL